MLQKYDPRNKDIVVNVNGVLVHRDRAAISPFDSVVQGGDAVWEGLRIYGGRVFRLTAHLDRLRRSAEALAFAQIPTHVALTHEIARTLEANGMRDGVHIRLTLTRGVKVTSGMDPRLNQAGPTLIVLAEHKAPVYAKTGLSLITSKMRRPGPEVLDQHIHSNNLLTSILAKLEANAAGADDALLLDGREFVAETNATHLFLVAAGLLVTPRTVACPEGITRATVLELCAKHAIVCEVRDVSLAEFASADEVFCSGTMGELAAVTKIDSHIIGSGEVGPMTKRLSELYRQLTATEGERVVP